MPIHKDFALQSLNWMIRGKRLSQSGIHTHLAFLVNYDETFGAIVDKQDPESDVYNLAMPGSGVDQMLLALQHYGTNLVPDLVIVGLCNADSCRSLPSYRTTERMAKPAFMLEKGELRPKTSKDRSNWLTRFLDRHSRIYAGTKLMIILSGYHHPVGERWHLNCEIIDSINKIGKNSNFEILYVYLPTRSRGRLPIQEKHMKKINYNFIDIRSGRIDNLLKLYFETDPHFDAAGHNFVANEIQDLIDSNPG